MIYRAGQTALCLTITFALAACPAERFRHEKYSCKSRNFDLESIIVNDINVGAEVKIIGYSSELKAVIKTINDDQIAIETTRMKMLLNRNNGNVKITRGTRFTQLACEHSVFTM